MVSRDRGRPTSRVAPTTSRASVPTVARSSSTTSSSSESRGNYGDVGESRLNTYVYDSLDPTETCLFDVSTNLATLVAETAGVARTANTLAPEVLYGSRVYTAAE